MLYSSIVTKLTTLCLGRLLQEIYFLMEKGWTVCQSRHVCSITEAVVVITTTTAATATTTTTPCPNRIFFSKWKTSKMNYLCVWKTIYVEVVIIGNNSSTILSLVLFSCTVFIFNSCFETDQSLSLQLRGIPNYCLTSLIWFMSSSRCYWDTMSSIDFFYFWLVW